MRACVFGMGAIGGTFAYALASSGHEVSAVARGATLAALHARGLRFGELGGGTVDPAADLGSVWLRVSERPGSSAPRTSSSWRSRLPPSPRRHRASRPSWGPRPSSSPR
jgi:2-dehydropantoate 2-reductase